MGFSQRENRSVDLPGLPRFNQNLCDIKQTSASETRALRVSIPFMGKMTKFLNFSFITLCVVQSLHSLPAFKFSELCGYLEVFYLSDFHSTTPDTYLVLISH